MNKNSIFIIVILFLLIVIGILAFNSLTPQKDTVQVGSTSFVLPENFTRGQDNTFNHTSITNGHDVIFLEEYNNTDINRYVNGFKNYLSKNNDSAEVTQFNVGDVIVYKATPKLHNTTTHYWFSVNNKVYTVYNWSIVKDMDNIVTELVKSL